MTQAKILLADDDTDGAESLAEVLEIDGYAIEIASDGQEALDKIAGDDFLAVIMDVRMPLMNGGVALAQMTRLRTGVPVIMITGDISRANVKRLIADGAHRVFFKPIDPAELLATLAAIDSRR